MAVTGNNHRCLDSRCLGLVASCWSADALHAGDRNTAVSIVKHNQAVAGLAEVGLSLGTPPPSPGPTSWANNHDTPNNYTRICVAHNLLL